MLKSRDCGSLRTDDVGIEITLAGWVHRRRDHGGLIFIDLRDSTGLVQIVFQPTSDEAFGTAEQFRSEWVVQIQGHLRFRPRGTENPNMPTGEVEVLATSACVLNSSKTPPFEIGQDVHVDEQLRMRYRYLDLRRESMRANLRLRHRITKFIRDYLDVLGFTEIETPILIKSTPEGARDYLVPSRNHPGQFYALPQSPQQLKQILMVAGTDRYFQIARCFRDEDLRADRQPEFTQLDVEVAFVDTDDIIHLMVNLYTKMAQELAPEKELLLPIPTFTYAEAMSRFGSDKPDIRFGLELTDLSKSVIDSEFQIFKNVIDDGGVVRGFSVPGFGKVSRRQIDDLIDVARSYGATGLVTIALDESIESISTMNLEDVRTTARALSIAEIRDICSKASASPGDLVLIAAGGIDLVNSVLGQLRVHVAQRCGLVDPNKLAFCVVTDFPLFEWDTDGKRWHAMHHPFTSPQDGQWDLLESNPSLVLAKSYDLAANGSELAGGSIRVHKRQDQERIFKVLGYEQKAIDDLFGHLLEAFEYGAPPHGGFAGGIDRLVVTLSSSAESIRDAIAFPKTQAGVDLLFGAPSQVEESQLKELHIVANPRTNTQM